MSSLSTTQTLADTDGRTERPSRCHRWLRRGFVVLTWLLALLLVECASRRYLHRLAPESGRIAVSVLRGEHADRQWGVIRPHPYMLYTYQPGWERFGVRQFNSLGHRGPEVASEPESGVTRVLAIGGSTTASYPYVERPEEAWPAQLQEMLRRQTGRQIEVINAGLGSATSAELLAHYMFRNRYLKPDIVIIHTGGNDVIPLMFADYSPEYTHCITGWAGDPLSRRPGELGLLRWGTARLFYAWWLQDSSIERAIDKKVFHLSLTPGQALENVRTNEPEGFRRNLDLLIRNIRDDGAVPVLFPFVLGPRQVFERKDIARYAEPFYDALAAGCAKDSRVIVELASDHGAEMIVMPADAIPVERFLDHCHLDAAGESIKASHVAQRLAPLIVSLSGGGDGTGRHTRAKAEAVPAGSLVEIRQNDTEQER